MKDIYTFCFKDDIYSIRLFINLNIEEDMQEELETHSESRRSCVVFLLYRMIKENYDNSGKPIPNLDDLEKIDDSVLVDFLESIINSHEDLLNHYDLLNDIESKYDRFCQAYKNRNDEMLKVIHGSVILFAENLNILSSSLQANIAGLGQAMETLQKSLYPISDIISNISIALSKVISKDVNILKATWGEENFIIRKNAFIKWAKYGWTIIDSAPISLFLSNPISQQEADRIALKHLNNSNINELFVELLKYRSSVKEIKEARKCYSNSCYRACAMIIISNIEYYLIRFQTNSGNCPERKSVGFGAVKKLEKHLSQSDDIDQKSIICLLYYNVINFLELLFMDTADFTKRFDWVNRNYLSHGLHKHDVRRKDCLKLLLALSNVINLFGYCHIKT